MRHNLRGLKQSKFFKHSLEMFGRELTNFFPDNDVRAVMIKADDDLADVAKDKQGPKFALPLWTYKLNSLDKRDTPVHNAGTLRRQGLILDTKPKRIDPESKQRPDDPNFVYRSVHLTPAAVSFDIRFYSDYEDIYDFGPMWQQAADGHFLNFEIMVGEKPVVVTCELNPSVSYGSIDLDNQNYSMVELSAVMNTYHGVVNEIKPVNSYTVKTNTKPARGSSTEAKLIPSLEITREKDHTVKIKRQVFGEDTGDF